jgi:hypothetical protein
MIPRSVTLPVKEGLICVCAAFGFAANLQRLMVRLDTRHPTRKK